ncbi:hypothetical protein MtrunA17_Chr5g0420761 [Medicago truncatula]|uniref:Uncharacterized protein n=1 Tax=Medicago truncatula TaxID=3880 RepID=A0A396HWC1_MEDTR|nr:hypothetical protein MtrunA17_Chr5g0420761 [Medicago truncatula]
MFVSSFTVRFDPNLLIRFDSSVTWCLFLLLSSCLRKCCRCGSMVDSVKVLVVSSLSGCRSVVDIQFQFMDCLVLGICFGGGVWEYWESVSFRL